jgi:hypothetical protein
MRAYEERLASEGRSCGDVLIRLLAGLLQEIELLRQPIRQFACDVDEPGIDVGSHNLVA